MSHAPRQRLQALYADDIDRIVRVVELSEGFIIQPVVVPNHDVAKAIVEELGARGIAAEWYPLDSEAAWLGLLGWLVEERGGVVDSQTRLLLHRISGLGTDVGALEAAPPTPY